MPSGLTGEGSSPLPGAYPVSTQSVAARRPAPGPTDLPLITHIRHSPKSVFPDSDRGPRGRRARLPPPTFHATTPSTHPTGVLPTRRAPIVSPHSDAGPVPTVGHGRRGYPNNLPPHQTPLFRLPRLRSGTQGPTGAATPINLPHNHTLHSPNRRSANSSCPHRLPALRCGAGTHGGAWDGRGYPTNLPPATHPSPVVPPIVSPHSDAGRYPW